MKTYWQIFKYNLSKFGIRSYLTFFLILVVTLIKIIYLGHSGNFFQFENIALDIPFILLFVLTIITVPINIIYLLKDSLKNNILLMIPDIRKKILVFSGSILLGIFIWSVILNFTIWKWSSLLIYSFFYTWYLSMLLSMLTGFKFIYKTNRYFLLKLFMQFACIWIPFVTSFSKDIRLLSAVIIGYISFILLVQFKNFSLQFSNYKEDKHANDSIRESLETDFAIALNTKTKESSLLRLLKQIKFKKNRFSIIRLYQYSLFDAVSNRVILIITYFLIFEIGLVILGIGKIKIGSVLISILVIRLSYPYFIRKLKNYETIGRLYILSNFKKVQFEKNILYSAFWYYTRILSFITILLLLHFQQFQKIKNWHYLFLPAVILLSVYLLIYLTWSKYIKNEDYTGNRNKKLGVSK